MFSSAKLLLGAAGLFGATSICAICLPGVASDSRVPAALATRDTATVKLAVRGMTCGSCAATARIALQRADGVYQAEVSFESASAVVQYDPAKTSPGTFIAHLKKLTGYEAAVVPASDPKHPSS
ncbi:MAG: heavy-metal-associated domain-containing protein [Gemmatimonadetes bacterium]|nr:heavy-metal-associated domain-containing protein [Gemmatimonadota bacterium]MBI2538004.1 heavy-metal-associated domain-containing protein [Gemmatimonadota bacterium]